MQKVTQITLIRVPERDGDFFGKLLKLWFTGTTRSTPMGGKTHDTDWIRLQERGKFWGGRYLNQSHFNDSDG
jgi:hypothetical protein